MRVKRVSHGNYAATDNYGGIHTARSALAAMLAAAAANRAARRREQRGQ